MIKKILKWFGLTVLVVILGVGSFAAHEWYAEKPFMFRAYMDRALVKIAFRSPETRVNGHQGAQRAPRRCASRSDR